MFKKARIAIGIAATIFLAVVGPWLVAAILMLVIGRFDSQGFQFFLLVAFLIGGTVTTAKWVARVPMRAA